MKKNNVWLLSTLIAVTALFSACKKEAGPAGPAGADGNANVKSLIITTTASDWVGDGDEYDATKSCSIITQDIVDKGAVLCYVKVESSYLPVPISIYIGGEGQYTEHFSFIYSVGSITFAIQDDDGYTQQPGNVTFKVVAVAAKALQTHPNVDLNNYEAVQAAFGLED